MRSLSPAHTRTLASDRAWLALLAALGVLSSFAVCLRFGALGDYPTDGGPSVDALAGGHVQEAAAELGGMGSFSVIFRAPLVALARAGGLGEIGAYQVGAIACLIVTALVAVWMATDRTVPVVTLLAMMGHWLMFDLVEPVVSPPAASRLYAVLTLILAAYLVRALGLFPPVSRSWRYGVWSPLRLRSQYRMK